MQVCKGAVPLTWAFAAVSPTDHLLLTSFTTPQTQNTNTNTDTKDNAQSTKHNHKKPKDYILVISPTL